MRVSFLSQIRRCVRNLLAHTGGSTAMTFTIALPVLVLAVGGGVDLMNAMSHRQKIASALEIACVQSALEINYKIANGSDAEADFGPGTVVPIANARITAAGINSGVDVTGETSLTDITIEAQGGSAAHFSQIAGVTSLPVTVKRECRFALPEQVTPPGETLFVESFEQGHSVARNSWTVLGQNGNRPSGAVWNDWQTHNAGVEINGIPQLSGGTIRFGNFFAELDSHCYVPGCNSNSAMSRIVELRPGNYRVGYWYTSRIKNNVASWRGVVACGPTETDPAVASYRSWNQETNRIELFVEREGDYSFAARNMVDVCVYADQWVHRTIDFQVQEAGEYRISWRAAGRQDTTGGLIDHLQLCRDACP
ncbi:MAG: hypothetical protein RJA14_1341 [Pseudomonadota bacterium]